MCAKEDLKKKKKLWEHYILHPEKNLIGKHNQDPTPAVLEEEEDVLNPKATSFLMSNSLLTFSVEISES